jgi:hypothetical protein
LCSDIIKHEAECGLVVNVKTILSDAGEKDFLYVYSSKSGGKLFNSGEKRNIEMLTDFALTNVSLSLINNLNT